MKWYEFWSQPRILWTIILISFFITATITSFASH